MILQLSLRNLFPILASLLTATIAPGQETYDLLIKNGRVFDGMGNPWRYENIAVKDGRIAWLGRGEAVEAERVIDAEGLYVAPGFIDAHSHADRGLEAEDRSHGQPLLAQGVTTVVLNVDGGGGNIDLKKQRENLLRHGLGVNVALMTPHGSIRNRVMGGEIRKPTDAELDEMRALVRQAMEDGSFGLSSGLYYAPGSYAKNDEVIELAKVASEYGGVYSSHIRSESDYGIGLVASVDEVIEVAREAQLPGIVTHIKALGANVWGYSGAVVTRIERAREQGVEVFADQYPYEASSTGLQQSLAPRFAQVRDDAEALRAHMEENLQRRGGAESLLISGYSPDPSIEGLTLKEVATERGVDPITAALQILEKGHAIVISFSMTDEDIHRYMQQDWTMSCSDGEFPVFGKGSAHPRAYGAFPRKLAKYARDEGVVELPFAIRSMTSLTASVFGMKDRGLIREGAIADIVVFDLEALEDNSTFAEPHQLSEGMRYVLVNGKLAIDDGEFVEERHGQVLRR